MFYSIGRRVLFLAFLFGLTGILYTGFLSWSIIRTEVIKEASFRLRIAASDLNLLVRDLHFEYHLNRLTSPSRDTELYLLQQEKLIAAVKEKAREAGLLYLVEDKNGRVISGSERDLARFRALILKENLVEVPDLSLVIHLGIPKEALQKTLRKALVYYAFAVFLGILIIVALGYMAYRLWIRRPLSRVMEALEGNKELRFCGIKEIDLLVKSIKEALKREKELVKRLSFTEKMSALGVLAGGYAHEFNNLLQIITAGLDLSERFIKEGKQEKALQFLERARKAALKGKEISTRILGLVRRKPSAEGFFLGKLIQQTIESLRSGLPKHIKLFAEKTPEEFYTPLSEEEWQEILLNLILNARDAIEVRGVEEGIIRVRIVQKEGLVGVEVEDNGCGIPEEIRSRIFEPFFTTKDFGKGTGLGLYLIHRLVTGAGGRVEVESTPGKGTVVRVLVPRAKAPRDTSGREEPRKSSPSASVPSPQGLRILVVDDEQDLRETLRELLRLWGYKSQEAASVEEAFKKIQKESYDLLLVDLFMPGKNGLQLIKSLPREFSGVVVLMTGFAGELEGEVQDLLRRGRIRSLLRKPFSSEEVKKVLEEVLSCG